MTKIKIFLCVLILITSFLLSLVYGIGLNNLVDILNFFYCKTFGKQSCHDIYNVDTLINVLFFIRLPRLVVAMLCGAALSSAGVVTQGLFRNPLVSPSVIGITSGSVLLAATSFYLFKDVYIVWFVVPFSAIVGAAIIATLMIFLIKMIQFKSIEYLLLVGVAINTFLGAFTTLIISFVLEENRQLYTLMRWLFGDIGAKTWEHVWIGLPLVIIGIVGALNISTKLDVLSLGEEVAQTLGVNIYSLKICSILVVAILVGGSTSMAGAISFVGLIVPHISRMIVGAEHKNVLILSVINGMSLLVISDFISRNIDYPYEIQIGVLTALLGSVFFLYLLLKNN